MASDHANPENGSFEAILNGFKVHYEINGKGPVVMALTNSWGFDAPGLRRVFGVLEDDLTLVTFDPRGMGGSGPVRKESDMGLAAVREDFDALRRHLGLERVHAIGWSNGAMNLLLLASERPETLRSAIFVHGTASFSADDFRVFAEQYPALVQAYRQLAAELAGPDLTVEEKTARMRRLWVETYFPATCADPEAMRPLLREAFPAESFSWPHAEYTNKAHPVFDARAELAAITALSLIISGKHDSMPQSKAEEMREGIAGSRLVVFENSGHFSPLEEPGRFRRVVLDFLREADRGCRYGTSGETEKSGRVSASRMHQSSERTPQLNPITTPASTMPRQG